MRRFKVFRSLLSLSLSICCLISCGLGTVKASAATNLINPDLSQWTAPFEGVDLVVNSINPTGHVIYRLQPELIGDINGVDFYMGYRIDDVLLKSGHTYTFSFHLPSWDELREYTSYGNNSDAWFAGAYAGDNSLSFGFGSILPDGTWDVSVEFLTLNNSNYQNYLGKDFVKSFTCPDYEGTDPFIFIYSNKTYASAPFFLDGSLMLVDNEEEDEEGFLSKLFEWFEERFNNISSNFSALKNKFNELGSNIGGFFSDLGSDIGNWFTNVGNWFSNLVTNIGNWFSELGENLRDWLNNLKQSVVDLGNSLLEGIKNLFVPDEQFILDWKDEMDAILSEKLGFLYLAAHLLYDFVELIFDFVSNSGTVPGSIRFPEIDFSLSLPVGFNSSGIVYREFEFDLFAGATIELESLTNINSIIGFLYSCYRIVAFTILLLSLVNYAYTEFSKRFR